MSDVLIPFGGEFLLLSQEQFQEALAHGREFVPQTTEQTGREDMILDAEGMAEVTQVPASWFLEQARKNMLPHLRVGKYVRFRLGEVLDFLSVSNGRQPLKAIR